MLALVDDDAPGGTSSRSIRLPRSPASRRAARPAASIRASSCAVADERGLNRRRVRVGGLSGSSWPGPRIASSSCWRPLCASSCSSSVASGFSRHGSSSTVFDDGDPGRLEVLPALRAAIVAAEDQRQLPRVRFRRLGELRADSAGARRARGDAAARAARARPVPRQLGSARRVSRGGRAPARRPPA